MKNNEVYEIITKKIIEQLQAGIIPWDKPWTGTPYGAFNRISKQSYSLLNQILLKHSGEYATFKQWVDCGGKIKKGAKSEFVVFWKQYQKKETTIDEDGIEIETVKNIPVLRYISVFHISQVEGVEPLKIGLRENIKDMTGDEIIKTYVKREGIKFETVKSDQAYYSMKSDSIHLPLFEQFKSAAEYYSTAFHELTHSTMTANRCNRKNENATVAAFGSEDYSKEELIAEIGAANLMNIAKIETASTFKNSVGYIQGWLRALQNDNRLIVSASSAAQKATNYILYGAEALQNE